VQRFIEIDGKRYAWRGILKLRKDQRKQSRQSQLTLFEMREDSRPASQSTVAGRYNEPTLFKVD